MHISIFDLFSIGIGPSSSHTVGPMKAAYEFIEQCDRAGVLDQTTRIQIDLYGSLALTGLGHGTDRAILMGLSGELPAAIIPESVDDKITLIKKKKSITLGQSHCIRFHFQEDLLFHTNEQLPKHSNGMRFSAFDRKKNLCKQQVYYSIGGGFITTAEDFDQLEDKAMPPYPFHSGHELFEHCQNTEKSVADIMLANERMWHDEDYIDHQLQLITSIMHNCIEKGFQTSGYLPGRLNLKRRAAILYEKLKHSRGQKQQRHEDVMNWVNLFAMAVNEENAAGGRIVTAPTNGAAGIIPAVLQYYRDFCEGADDAGSKDFLLTAGAIAILYKKGASISGAEVGCQGEVGVAASMAAGALCAVLGGNITQVENAAEIAMEHHLGMTCDPVGGLVQIPCIERNAMGAIKAINAAHLALMETTSNRVSLDEVIATMLETGQNMMSIYKETSQGGLAVNVVEC